MRTFHSYEDMSVACKRYLPEAYSGTSIVQWYGNIERQLARMLDENESTRNYVYADKLRQFLKTWRDNEVTGSLNRDTLMILKTACEQLAVDAWNLDDYFSNLRDQLRKLLASEEELPRGDGEPDGKMTGPGGGSPGGSLPPLSPEFGPEKEMPVGGPDMAGGADMSPEGEMPEEEGLEGPGGPEDEEDRLGNANAAPPPRSNV